MALKQRDITKRLEDLLATDDLFIDYFNDFLSLPTFPEPLCFNKESGGFEIYTEEKKRLAEEIKAAARCGRRRKRIYRPVKNHAFSDIPLIPMEQPPMEEEREIDTCFTVKTLNKEQGIEWIKKERLPSFLESDCYIEYRLAKLVSQAQPAGVPGEVITFKLERADQVKKPKKTIEEKLAQEVDQTKMLMQNMFVCMGSASTTDTEAWVAQAKMAHGTTTTTSSSNGLDGHAGRPVSAVLPSRFTRPGTSKGRPASALSVNDPAYRSDSGFGSASKGSLYGSTMDLTTVYSNSVMTHDDRDDLDEEDEIVSKLFGPDLKPVTPRPSDTVCLLADSVASPPPGGPVYSLPVPPPPEEPTTPDTASTCSDLSHMGMLDSGLEHTQAAETYIGLKNDTDNGAMVFENLDQLGSVLVGTILKSAVMAVTGLDEHQVMDSSSVIRTMLVEDHHRYLNKESIDKVALLSMEDNPSTTPQQPTTTTLPAGNTPDKNKKAPEKERESDEDSLLNSDDDYEKERDSFFRKKKRQKCVLVKRKGIQMFKTFLLGTLGEKNWNFWLDVERAKLIKNPVELSNYLVALRERYQKHGAPYELSSETKVQLALTMPSAWTLEKLSDVQSRMVEPLIRYWAPRFLLRQNNQVCPKRNYIYCQQKELQQHPEPHPNPPTVGLLPLRPKTCMPRIRDSSKDVAQPAIEGMYNSLTREATLAVSPSSSEPSPTSTLSPSPPPCRATTPRVGMRRRYDIPEAFKIPGGKGLTSEAFRRSCDKNEKEKQNLETKNETNKKCPKQLISALLQSKTRPHTAHGSRLSRPRSPQDQWETSSVSSAPEERLSSSRVPSTRSKQTSVVAESELSEFVGGRRMEGLLQALANERKAGGVIKRYLNLAGNQRWNNGLTFWLELQEYHKMFYSEVLDAFLLAKKAKHLYSQYIVTSAPLDIGCMADVKHNIFTHLLPPFEELFDMAEEYILEILYEAWSQMLVCDITTFDKVELREEKRHLNTKSKYFQTLQKRGVIKDRPESPEDPMAGYTEPVYDEALLEQIPEEFREYSLEKLVHNRIELEHFRVFLAENYASMDLLCWMDIEAFRRIPHTEDRRRDLKAKDIRRKYLNKKYFFGPNSPAGKEGQEKVMEESGGWGKLLDERPPSNCLVEAQKYVRQRLEKKWLPLFLANPDFAERQRPQSNLDDVVEDVMIQRKKKTQAIWKMLESRWVSSSKDVIVFRKALLNPITSLQFRRYVSIKGDTLENDVLFWQEVQRYKDLCHQHSDRSLIQHKIAAIVNCFLDSPIPPTLQVDITQDMADNIIDRKSELAPYLFREAQLTVFRVLFSHWTDFCTFRSNLTEDKILPTIERHRRRAKADERRRRNEEERKKEKEIAKKRALGIPIEPEEEPGDVNADPFEKMAAMSDEEEGEGGGKEAVSWSYSQYMNALDEEEVLNEVDESTFSSLMSLEHRSEFSGSAGRCAEDASDTSHKRLKNKARIEDKSKSFKVTSEAGSQTDVRPKSAVRKARVSSASERSDSSVQERNGSAQRNSKDDTTKSRLGRRMPPLVAKK